jgi:hypothetical protein
MNSDKFDRIVLDLLYGELDELTTAAAKRHMDQSARAREIFAHFKATRQLSVLPAHAPPADFEAALMERERRALAELPLHHRIGRLVSMLAGYAMRPQLIMGALLLLMIGSSLMFLRARPGQHGAMQVTERGAPEADVDLVLPEPLRSRTARRSRAASCARCPGPTWNGLRPRTRPSRRQRRRPERAAWRGASKGSTRLNRRSSSIVPANTSRPSAASIASAGVQGCARRRPRCIRLEPCAMRRAARPR